MPNTLLYIFWVVLFIGASYFNKKYKTEINKKLEQFPIIIAIAIGIFVITTLYTIYTIF